MRVVITGVALRSAMGDLKCSWHSMLQGKTGITYHQPFPYFPPLPLGLIDLQPTTPDVLIYPMISEVLKDAGISPPLPHCPVVVGSSRGYQYRWEQFNQSGEGLGDWLNTLPHQSAITVAKILQTTGPVLAPMAACATGIWTIFHGYQLLQQGSYPYVLAGAVETPVTPLSIAGFQQMGALATTGCYPFASHREGLVVGEGGAVFLLEPLPCAIARQAFIYAEIKGFGFSCDALHISAPEPQGIDVLEAIQQCLQRSNLTPTDIGFIHAHGTGTHLNDQREAHVIHTLFPHVPVISTKGATGHTLGASAALGLAFSLLVLKEQKTPGCVGCERSNFSINITPHTRAISVENLLNFSFGFGGQNAVMAIGLFPEST